MGQAGRKKAQGEYSPGRYYERLMAVYKKAIELGPNLGKEAYLYEKSNNSIRKM
jgi:hypothetical protein